VVLGGGVNDLASGHSADRAYADLQALLALVRSRAPGAYIYLITIPPCPENAACKRVSLELEKFDDLLRSTQGAYVIDMSGVGSTGKDGLHRTAAGYAEMAQNVAGALQ
jgi:lysophospholipase L1-like esterase